MECPSRITPLRRAGLTGENLAGRASYRRSPGHLGVRAYSPLRTVQTNRARSQISAHGQTASLSSISANSRAALSDARLTSKGSASTLLGSRGRCDKWWAALPTWHAPSVIAGAYATSLCGGRRVSQSLMCSGSATAILGAYARDGGCIANLGLTGAGCLPPWLSSHW